MLNLLMQERKRNGISGDLNAWGKEREELICNSPPFHL